MAKAKKQKSETLINYEKWNRAKKALYVGMFSAPLAPATIMTIVNWDEWFKKSNASLPMGFALLLVSTLLSVLAMWKRDDLINKKISFVFYLCGLFVMFGASFLFLANLMAQVGYMFLATAGGLAISGTADQVNKSLVKKRVEEYKQLIEENALDERSKQKRQRKEQAKLDAEKEEKERQAIE